jgi:hypothetical protein
MNERIRELEKQATEIVKCGLNGTSTAESFNRKKFAELIVRECAGIVKFTPTGVSHARIIEIIKEHFGVEE